MDNTLARVMMIFKDTQCNWIDYTQPNIQHPLCEKLVSNGITLSFKRQLETGHYHGGAPVIWLLVFQDYQHFKQCAIRTFHANHEAFIYCFKNIETDNLLEMPNTNVHLSMSLAKFIDVLLEEEQRILQRNLFQSQDINDDFFLKSNFLGRSPAYVETINTIKKMSNADVTVFIKGETGTGKELTARAIHYLSSRRNEPFIPINCGAFNDDLVLSELFGYEKGAFTGANKAKEGLLKIANQGTIFLDEIDSLSKKAQVSLLRYLQDNEIRPIGSSHVEKVNVRVIAASNQSLSALIAEGEFREDLFYRLDVLTLTLPPLHQRDEDIQLLAQYFLAQLALDNNNQTKYFNANLIHLMQGYQWPGNIRELENFVKRAYFLSQGEVIKDESLLNREKNKVSQIDQGQFSRSFNEEKQGLIRKFEKEYLNITLLKTQGNISRAAVMAQKERRSFCRLMKKYGLERQHYIN